MLASRPGAAIKNSILEKIMCAFGDTERHLEVRLSGLNINIARSDAPLD